jgi:hypothetical protein
MSTTHQSIRLKVIVILIIFNRFPSRTKVYLEFHKVSKKHSKLQAKKEFKRIISKSI